MDFAKSILFPVLLFFFFFFDLFRFSYEWRRFGLALKKKQKKEKLYVYSISAIEEHRCARYVQGKIDGNSFSIGRYR